MTHPSQEAQKLADDIANCIECIEQNSIVGGPINGTIWFGDAATLVDELHRIMERLRTQPVNQQPDTAALLNLLADIRQACGDNGKRMQDELVEHIRAGFAELALLRSQQPVSGGDFDAWFDDRYPNREDRQSEFRMTSVRDLMREAYGIAFGAGCVHGAEVAARLSAPQAAGWLPMNSAPLDGTRVRLNIRHANWWAAKKVSDVEAEHWEANVEAEWIDFNGGGWTWNGMAGMPVGWQPLPAPPTQQGDGNG